MKTLEDFKKGAEELRKMYEPFKKFEEAEDKRHQDFYGKWSALPNETYEEYHKRTECPEYHADSLEDLKQWYKNMAAFNGVKLWDMLSEERQNVYLLEKTKVEKWHLIEDVKNDIEQMIHEFNCDYHEWHFQKYGWTAF